MSIIKRILQFIEYKGITKYEFHKINGFSNGFLDKDRAIGSDKCEKILENYPELSPEWLVTGKGEMLKKESAIAQNGTNNIVQNGNKSKAKIISTEENVCFLREKIALLEEKEALYKDKIAYLTQEVERLKNSK